MRGRYGEKDRNPRPAATRQKMESEACRQSLRSATQPALACCLVLDALAIFPQRFRFTRAAWVDDVFPQRDEARSSVSFAQGHVRVVPTGQSHFRSTAGSSS